jgi:hypothetical protein
MPSRRQAIQGIGATLVGGLAGCASDQTISGTVTQKQISVGVPNTTSGPVEVPLAVLTYEPDQQLVTGEFADIATEVIDGPSITVSDAVHERFDDRFAFVHYTGNIVPQNGSDPANGRLTQTDFNSLEIGSTATVDPYMRQVESDQSVGYLRVTKPGDCKQFQNTSVGQYSWEERVENIQR